MDRYTYQNGKKLRYGYTTGSTATGASLGALLNLLDKKIDGVTIRALNGWDIPLVLHNQIKEVDSASASVVKDAGDDPDITNGIHIHSKVSLGTPLDNRNYFINNKKNIYLVGGIGVGKVTKKGLQVGVGYSAINPGPQKMIFETLEKVIPENTVVTVEIYIPEGEEKSKKTFNPKLGIVGGISVLGSTGIVKPMSEEAWIDSIKMELSIYKEEKGTDEALFTFGNYGKRFLKEEKDYSDDEIIVISNFVGTLVDEAYRLGFKKIVLCGHIGKFIKLAGGVFHTHSKIADARLEILTACAVIARENLETLEKIINSNTTEEAVEYIDNEKVWNVVGERSIKYLKERTYGEIDIEVAFFSFEKGKLYDSRQNCK